MQTDVSYFLFSGDLSSGRFPASLQVFSPKAQTTHINITYIYIYRYVSRPRFPSSLYTSFQFNHKQIYDVFISWPCPVCSVMRRGASIILEHNISILLQWALRFYLEIIFIINVPISYKLYTDILLCDKSQLVHKICNMNTYYIFQTLSRL